MTATLATSTVDGELVHDVSFALSAALASAMAALREARHRGLPAPFGITVAPGQVHVTAPFGDVLELQKILDRRRIAAADYRHGLIRVEGEFDGQPWTLTSMQHRHITGGTR